MRRSGANVVIEAAQDHMCASDRRLMSRDDLSFLARTRAAGPQVWRLFTTKPAQCPRSRPEPAIPGFEPSVSSSPGHVFACDGREREKRNHSVVGS